MEKTIAAQINNAEEQLLLAMLASDVRALDELLASELIFTNHLGHCLGKEADISAHKSGAYNIYYLQPSEQQIKLVGDYVAIVSVRMQIAGDFEGKPAAGDFRFTRVWAQSSDGKWQVVAAHASIIA